MNYSITLQTITITIMIHCSINSIGINTQVSDTH